MRFGLAFLVSLEGDLLINFNVPPYVGNEMEYVREACEKNHKICGDGPFSKKCHEWLEQRFGTPKALLTTSGTAALEMAAILCDLKPGDEVILPSFTFSSTATAFQMVGATLVFVDIRPDTMNMDETKNYSMGEGGAILVNDPAYIERAEIIREKGTNRQRYFRHQVDKYTWVDRGGSYLQSDMNAAYLFAQLENADLINENRLASWNDYYTQLEPLAREGKIELPTIPDGCVHNAHMFYLKTRDLEERTALIAHLKECGVQAVYHYVPLHSSPAGRKFGRFSGEDVYTTRESDRLVRLPMYYGLTARDREWVIATVKSFYA